MMTLLYYLLRKILTIKGLQHKIKYETLYRDFCYENDSKQNKENNFRFLS